MKKDTLANKIIFKKYKLLNEIGKGSSGYVYSGENIITKTKVAVKLEERLSPDNLLQSEASFLSLLKAPGFPKIISYGINKKYNILIEQLLGENLEQVWAIINNFSIKDLAMMAIQIIDRIEYVHSKDIVYRDVKPKNFLLGLNDKTFLYLIDFGISRKYRSSRGKHLKYSLTGKFYGTLKFSSYNATRGVEQSRRDDLESIGYTLVFLSGEKLPWQDYELKGNYDKTNYNKILELKKTTKPELICRRLPEEFVEYIKYCKNLKFEENPDYEKLRNLFRQVLLKSQAIYDCNFSWLIKVKSKNKIYDKKDDNNITMRKNYTNLIKRKQSPRMRLFHSIQNSFNNEISSIAFKNLIDNKIIKEKENNNINIINHKKAHKSDINFSYINSNKKNDIAKINKYNKKKFNLSLDLDKNFFMDNNFKINRSVSESIKNKIKIKRTNEEIKRQILCKNVYIKILNKYNNYIEIIRKKIRVNRFKKIDNKRKKLIKQNNNNNHMNIINKYFSINDKNLNKKREFFNQSTDKKIKKNDYIEKGGGINNLNNNVKICNNNGGNTIKKNLNNQNNKIFNSLINDNGNNKKIIIINNHINSFNNCYTNNKYINNNIKKKSLKINHIQANKIKNLVNKKNQKELDNLINNHYLTLNNENKSNIIFEQNQNNTLQNYSRYKKKFNNTEAEIISSNDNKNYNPLISSNNQFINNNQQLNQYKKMKIYLYKSIANKKKSKNNSENFTKNFNYFSNKKINNNTISNSQIKYKNKIIELKNSKQKGIKNNISNNLNFDTHGEILLNNYEKILLK